MKFVTLFSIFFMCAGCASVPVCGITSSDEAAPQQSVVYLVEYERFLPVKWTIDDYMEIRIYSSRIFRRKIATLDSRIDLCTYYDVGGYRHFQFYRKKVGQGRVELNFRTNDWNLISEIQNYFFRESNSDTQESPPVKKLIA